MGDAKVGAPDLYLGRVDPTSILFHGGLALDLVGLAVRIAAILVVPVNRRPSSAMAWLLAIFLIPYLGIIAFLLIGNPKLPKARRAKQREINNMIAEAGKDAPEVVLPAGSEWLSSHRPLEPPTSARCRCPPATPPR